jgi:hypothetical protein
MSEKFGKLPTRSPRESADYLNHAFESSDIDEICKAIGVVAQRHNISGKKPELKDRACIALLQAAQSIQT